MIGGLANRFEPKNAKAGQVGQVSEKQFFCLYIFFFSALAIGYQSDKNLGLSTFITLSVALQFLAYSLLALKVIQQKSVRGISAKSLQCQALVYIARLSSTTWLKGYIPTDSTGQWLYQATDAMTLLVVIFLLHSVQRRYRYTYQAEEDSFEIGYLLSGCLVLAVMLHPHLNSRPMFDTLWTFALYVDVFAMMPQLWMVAKLDFTSGLEILNAHFLAGIAAADGVSLFFWFYGFREFAPKNGSFNTTGWAIMGAHVIQCLLLLDFMVYYVKACISKSMVACPMTSQATVSVPANVHVSPGQSTSPMEF